MYDILNSMNFVQNRYAIPHESQLQSMKDCVKAGLYPFEYFDNGMFLNSNVKPKDYLGIEAVNRMYKICDPNLATYHNFTIRHAAQSKYLFNLMADNLLLPQPRTKQWEYFVENKISFIAKPNRGYGGQGFITFEYSEEKQEWSSCSNWINYSSMKDWCERLQEKFIFQEFLPSNIPCDNGQYTLSGYRVLMFFKNKQQPSLIGHFLRYQYFRNYIDNFVSKNGIASINPIGRPTLVISGDYQLPIKEIPCPKGLTLSKAMMNIILDDIKSFDSYIDAPKGVILGFDVLLRLDKHGTFRFYFTEMNHRTGISTLQIVNRNGLRPLISDIIGVRL